MLKKREYKTFDLVRLAFIVTPLWASVLLIQQLLGAFLPALSVLVTANFIDTAIAIVTKGESGTLLYAPMIALSGIVLYQWVMGDIRKYIDSRIRIATRVKYKTAIIRKCTSLDYRYIEDQAAYDLIKRVIEPSDAKVLGMYVDMIDLTSTIINVTSILAILMIHVWWAALAIFFCAVPIFFVAMKAGKSNYDAGRDVNKIERQALYLTEVSTKREYVAERTLFGYAPKIIDTFWERFEFARKYKQKVERKNFIRMKAGGVMVSLVSAFIMLILLQPVASSAITIGLFMSLINACSNLSVTLSWGLSNQMSKFARNKEYLKDLSVFCSLEETEGALEPRALESPAFKSLEFKNVSFAYPGTENLILKHLSFTMKAEKHYAFVGENGAGKTTIIKLLTGQYSNYEGEILLNGKDIKGFTNSELKSFFSVAYQDFARYALTVKENLSMGDLKEHEIDRMNEVIGYLELNDMIENFADGLDTPLGKISENGVDLSGGQWQRIALARVALNLAPIKVLDEPTAALDPLSESRLYEQFEKIIQGGMSIFISHRLGSIKLADEILVLKDGTLIEEGKHLELMRKEGYYFEMYQSQLKWYQGKEEVSV